MGGMAPVPMAPVLLRTVLITAIAMIAFAANSVICRLALSHGTIDPASFTTVRLSAGALALSLIIKLRGSKTSAPMPRGNWLSGAMLYAYAIGFSFAYQSLGTATGALILFGLVQLTMLVAAIAGGARPPVSEWGGLLLAAAGLVWLVLPGLSAPPLGGALLMGLAGVAWGVYSLRGRWSSDALGDTAGNFLRSVPLALVTSLLLLTTTRVSATGIGWAVLSGAVTSALGYVVWYTALRGLTPVRAAVVQLSVPVLAAMGGVWFLGEALTLRLWTSAALILGGIALALVSRINATARY